VIVVSDSSPLISLARIGRLELLQGLFGEVFIPQAVYAETVVVGREKGSAKQPVSAAAWIKTVIVRNSQAVVALLSKLDQGEAETIVLAQELNAEWVLMDEKAGRRKLTEMGINKIGTLGILLRAKSAGLLSAVRPDIEKLRAQHFSISQAVIDAILKEANEL
jgi:hypothetical protein